MRRPYHRHMHVAFALLSAWLLAAGAVAQDAPLGDSVLISVAPGLEPTLEAGGRTGRVILLLKGCDADIEGDPIEAPFFEAPQPMFSVSAARLSATQGVVIGPRAESFPVPIDELAGCFEIQAVFDRDRSQSGHRAPGNLISGVQRVEFHHDTADSLTLTLDRVIPDEPPPPEVDGIKWISLPSERLTAALGRSIVQRAGVVFPLGYDDVNHPRRHWPTIYVIPGFGGDHTMAVDLARHVRQEALVSVLPQAVWVVLDPDGHLGHHGFVDSPCNGPRAEALISEFIPALEQRFRLIPEPKARLLTGHSSGGWSSLWLMLTHPESFGGCWSSSPDPVDFSAFQASDLYADANIFTDTAGNERPSFRTSGRSIDVVRMTNREEIYMERVLSPEGASGEQWDAWAAMFSPRGLGGLPRRLYNPRSGAIDQEAVQDWSAFDISKRVERDWTQLAPVLAQRVHLLCGSRDSFYLERAVGRLRDQVATRNAAAVAAGQAAPSGDGFIEIVDGLDHGTLVPLATLRFNSSMRQYLDANGLGAVKP